MDFSFLFSVVLCFLESRLRVLVLAAKDRKGDKGRDLRDEETEFTGQICFLERRRVLFSAS